MADYDQFFQQQGAAAPAPAADPAGPQILEPSAAAAPLEPAPVAQPVAARESNVPKYDQFFDNFQQSQRQQAQSSFYSAQHEDPDRAGKVLNLAAETGVAPDFVARNLDPMERDQQFGLINIPKLSRLNPAITKLASDPIKAAAIKDDLPGLRKAEATVQDHTMMEQAGSILGAAVLDLVAGVTKIPALASDILDYRENLARKMVGDPTRKTSDDTFYGRNNPVTRYLEDTSAALKRNAPILQENPIDAFAKPINSSTYAGLPERAMDAITQGDYVRGAQVLVAQGVSQAPMLFALFGSAALGAGPLAALALGAQTAADKNAANLEAGVDPVAGVPNAAAHGAIVSYLDRLGAFEYFSSIGGRLTQKFGPQVSAKVMGSFGETIAHTMGMEAAKMGGMSAAGDFADFATGVNKDAFAGFIARTANAGLLGAAIGGATTAPVEGFVRLQEARRAQLAKNLVQSLTADSAGKTRDRSPELHTEFVRNTVEGTPYAEAQIDPQALETFFQKKGEDPVKAMQDLGFLDRFAHAKETGTRVRIPTEELVDKIQKSGHTDLADHVTFHEEDSSVADLELRRQTEEQVAQASKEALDQAESVALNERGLTPDQQRAESAETVRAHIEKQLEDAGQDKRQAIIVSKTIQTLAARTGQDPLELFNRINFSISGPGSKLEVPSNAVKLNQNAADTAEISAAKEVLNRIDTPEKAVRLKGDERKEYLAALDTIYGAKRERSAAQGYGQNVVFHGTADKFDAFRRGRSADGNYFTDNRELARDYAQNAEENSYSADDKARVIDARVRAENPLVVDDDGTYYWGQNHDDLIERAKAEGYDSVQINNTRDNIADDSGHDLSTTTIALHPDQIRSTRAAFDPRFKDSPLLLAQSDAYRDGFKPTVDTFFSKLTRTVEEKMPNSAPPDQVRGILRDMKPEEKKWLQVEDFLKDKTKVSKAELLEFLRANDPQIVDVTKRGGTGSREDALAEAQVYGDDGEFYNAATGPDGETLFNEGPFDTEEEAQADGDARLAQHRATAGPATTTQYSQYTLPGGENYREVLFTLPDSDADLRARRKKAHDDYLEVQHRVEAATKRVINEGGDWSRAHDLAIEKGYITRADIDRALELRQAHFDIADTPGTNYYSSHWKEPNVLAFTRLNDRVDAQGKRVLHVEEVQSDWHQAGRKKGYAGDDRAVDPQHVDDLINGRESEANRNADRIIPYEEGKFIAADLNGFKDLDTVADTKEEAARKFIAKHDPRGAQVPDAPFRKTWHEFALKKIIRMAAEGGYDKVTWTTGEQQADRYNLAKQIDSISYKESKNGGTTVSIYDKRGHETEERRNLTPTEIEQFFGKDVAQRIADGVGDEGTGADKGRKVLRGVNLSVGGEGMKGFYDKIIPDYLRKFGKKYGATVGETHIPVAAADVNTEGLSVEQDLANGDWKVIDDNGLTVRDGFESRDEAKAFLREGGRDSAEPQLVHALEMTPQLRDAALHQGFELFQGGEETPRGQISIAPDRINIQLLEKADRSTFLHETGHFIVEMMRRLSTENEGIKADFDTLMRHVGNDGGEITVAQHEEIARSFEGYIMEGKAPSEALRKAFVRMKTWLVDVYRHIRALNINLTDDVRGVFDRVLATDDEIAAAREDQNFGTLFSGPARQQLTPEQYAKIGFAVDAAKEAAEDHLRAEVMEDIKKEETAAWAKGLEGEREKARAVAEGMDVFKARALLQRGETPTGEKLGPELQGIKLNRQALVDMFGKEVLDQLPKPIVYSKDGLHPDAVADMLGYENAKALVDDLRKYPKMSEWVDQTAESAMKQKSPDLYKSARMPEEALKAIHNNEQAKVLRLEMDYLRAMSPGAERDLTRMIARRPPPPDRVLKDTVRAELGRMTFTDVRPNAYRIAERQAAKAAGEALAKGDIDGAYEAKRRELLNHELYRAATEAQDDVAKTMKFFKKLNGKDEDLAKSRDINLVNTARAILAMNGIGKADQAPKVYLEKMRAYDPEGYEAAAYHVANVTNQITMNYRENTMGNFRAMADSVRAIWELARDTKTLDIEGKKVQRDEIVNDLIAQIGNTGDLGRVKEGTTRAITKAENIKLNLMSWRAALTRVEHWVHGKDLSDLGGVFTKHIWDPIQAATTTKKLKYAEMMETYRSHVAKFKEIFDTKPIESRELGYTFANKKELLGALMHTGNESNMSKLLRGRNWGSIGEDGTLDRSRWDAFINRMHDEGVLKKADYDFVQGVWDMYESIKPDAQKAHKKMFGYHFNEVTADAFQTPFGEYKGGYAPAVADPNMANDAAMRREAEAFGNHGNMMLMPTGGRGFTKNRVEGYAAPLALDLDYVPMAVDKVLRFTYVEGAARDVSKLVFDRRFAEALNTVDPGSHEMLISWLNRAAKQSAGMPSGQGRGWRALDGFFRAVRTRTGLGAMAGNVVNAIHQTTGFSVVTALVEPHFVRDSLQTYLKDAKQTTTDIMEKSEWMRAHHTDPHSVQGEIEDMMINPGKIKSAEEWAKKNAYILQRYTAGLTEAVAWRAAYSKALAEGKSDAEAVLFGDSVVRRTQHSMDAIDVAAYETGSPLYKMFTQFTGYYNNKANLLGSKAMASIRELGIKKAAIPLIGLYASVQMIPAIMAKATYRLAEGKLDENDDGRWSDDVWNLFFGSQVDEALALAPFVGPTLKHIGTTAASDRPRDERFVMAPGFALIEKLGMVIPHTRDAIKGKGKPSAAIKDWMTLVGMMSGLPTQPLAKPIGYMADVASGKVKSRGPLDYTRGLITGYGPRH